MTFKHKLSMRLALMRDRAVMVAAAALVASCTPADQSISDPPRPSYATAVASSGTILLQEGFEDNAFGARGWYDNASMATSTAQHLPGSASAAEFHFPAGATTPTSGGAARHLFPASPTLYVSYWVKYSSNWVGSGRLYHPHEFLVLSDQDGDWDGPSNNWLTLYVEHFYQNGGIPRLAVQDNKAINTSYGALPVNLTAITENRSTAGCNGIVEPNMPNECYNAPPWYNDKKIDARQPYFSPTAGPGYKGDWNHVEVYFQLNSVAGGVGVADGVMQYWFNGALVIDRHDILYRTGARSTLQLHQFLIAPYIGDGSPVDQYMWVDDLTLATGRVGSDTIPPAPTNPGSVADLAVTGVTDSSATLSFTEVSDGTGLPASYDVRFAVAPLAFWSASDVAVGTCKVPTAGMAIGAKRTCTVLGLVPTTAYQFQLVPFRGTLNLNAVFGGLSNIASGTSAAKAPVSVASVAVSPATGSLLVGNTLTLAASPKDAGGNVLTGRVITWTSSNPAVATVNASGLVAADAAGSATITATSEGVEGTAAITVAGLTNPGNVTDLAVSALTDTSVTLTFTEVSGGDGQPASYDARWKTGTFAWTSAIDVARGTCNVPMAGTAIGAKRSCTVLGLQRGTAYGFQVVAFRGTLNVNAVFGALSNVVKGTTTSGAVAPVASVTLSPASANLAVGAAQQLAATLQDAAGNTLTGRTVTWASSAPAVATVNAGGLVTAVSAGSATITATSEGVQDTASVTATVKVTNPGTVTDLRVTGVSDSSVTLAFTEVTDGAGAPAKYDIRWVAGKLSWSSATDVARGSCTVPMAGTAVGATRSCTVLGLTGGTSYQFQLVALRGTLNLNAVFGGFSNVASGTTGSNTAPVASVAVAPGTASVGVGSAQQFTVALKDANGNTLSGRSVSWASNALGVATVNGSGLVNGMVAGTATITATSEGQSGSSAVTVTAMPPQPPPSSGWAHEPSGVSVVEEQGWESGLLGNWTLYYQTADKPITVVPITDSPLGESYAFQIGYLPGHQGGGGTEARFEIPAAYQRNEIFVGYYVQVNSLWQGHNSGINKMVFLADGGQSGFSAMWYEMFGSGSSPLGLYVVNQSGGSPAGFHENGTAVNFTRGAWHKVEIYQKQGSPGIVRVWVDDVLAIDRSDVYTRAAPLDAVAISGIWGGVGDVKAQFDYMRFDRIHISVR